MTGEYRVFCSMCGELESDVHAGSALQTKTFHEAGATGHSVKWFQKPSGDGMLVSIEGIDGSGKTTLWENLKDEFGDDDSFVFTREPRKDTWYGEAVYRSLNNDDSDPVAELFLYLADHANHLSEVVLPALQEGKVVVTDRYLDSRCAYQAANIGSLTGEDDVLQFLHELHQSVSVFPDLTLFTAVSPEVSVERSEQANKFEELGFLEDVEANYRWLSMTEPGRFVEFDTEELSAESVASGASGVVRSAMEYGSIDQ